MTPRILVGNIAVIEKPPVGSSRVTVEIIPDTLRVCELVIGMEVRLEYEIEKVYPESDLIWKGTIGEIRVKSTNPGFTREVQNDEQIRIYVDKKESNQS